MTVFKCKMCGASLDIVESSAIATCKYCNSTMTVPRLSSERRVNLYDRANYYRRNGDFDQAATLFENLRQDDPTDAEAYWSLVLCKYGIEYVEDPQTHRRVPTCNRTQFTSILSNEDYMAAVTFAEPGAKEVYESEAQAIDDVLRKCY